MRYETRTAYLSSNRQKRYPVQEVFAVLKKKYQKNALFFTFCVTQAHLKDNIYSLWVDAVLNRVQKRVQKIVDPNSASTTGRA